MRELSKEYFPHLFNVPEKQNYVGLTSESECYCPDEMSTEGRAKFYQWYEGQRGTRFDMQAKLPRYCLSDVDISQRCCEAFRGLFAEHTGPELYTKAYTIAGLAVAFTALFIREKCN